ncbi:hypothetical protein [Pyrococcus abyssi]|uniref:hypothetical protein n=1 Tax=Pyrococcus abyssi TaxID=29292 RepID=UPI001E35A749|nr:hypothetical protein [Pyrococcus abyssi]
MAEQVNETPMETETSNRPVEVKYPRISVKQGNGYTRVEYVFDEVYWVNVIPNGVVLRSGSGLYFINGKEVKKYDLEYGNVRGVFQGYLVAVKGFNVVVMNESDVVWEKPLEPDSSVGVGKDFVVIVEPYYDAYHDLNANVTFYFPGSGEKLKYHFRSGQVPLEYKLLVTGEYAIVGILYPWYEWELVYFKNGRIVWREDIGRGCAKGASISEVYIEFELSLDENGYGYTLSDDGRAVNYFNEHNFKGICLNSSRAVGVEVFDGCIALKMKYLGKEKGIYFYKWGDSNVEDFKFKENFSENTVSSDKYLLALYNDHASIFDCSGEVLRIAGSYEKAYPLKDDFVLVNETHIYLPFRNLIIKIEGIKIIGSFKNSIVGVQENKVIIINISSA